MNRIGRVGNGKEAGLASTFLYKSYDQGLLVELKDLLKQYGQTIPPFLEVVKDNNEHKMRCNYCGSNKHYMKHCLKHEKERLQELAGVKSDGKEQLS